MKFFLFIFFLLSSAFAHAEGDIAPTIHETTVNGFTVYLINTHQGNEVSSTTDVEVGAWHGSPGLPHFMEHDFLLGSTQNPGPNTIGRLFRSLGTFLHAGTNYTNTIYTSRFLSSDLPKILKIQGAPLSGLSWNKKDFANELAIVKKEAAASQIMGQRALDAAPFLYAARAQHPLAMYEVGTKSQLDAITMPVVKNFYYANYSPAGVNLIISGDFDHHLNEASVLQTIRENFNPPVAAADPDVTLPVAPPAREMIFPSTIDSENPARSRSVELGTTENEHVLTLTFENQAPVNRDVLEVLNTYLDRQLYLELGREGLITGCNFIPVKLNNLEFTRFKFYLTEKGAETRATIPKTFFNVLHQVQTQGIKVDYLEYLKKGKINFIQRMFSSTEDHSRDFALTLAWGKDEARRFFDTDARFATITNSDIQKTLKDAFSPDYLLTAYLGPDVTSPELDATFHRPIRFADDYLLRTELKNILQLGLPGKSVPNLFVPNFDLPFSTEMKATGVLAGRELPTAPQLGVHLILQENNLSLNGGLKLNLSPRPLSLDETASLAIYLNAFKQSTAWQTNAALNSGVRLNIDGKASIIFEADGNAEAARAALTTLFQQFRNFSPTDAQIQQQVTLAQANFLSQHPRYSTDVSGKIALTLLHQNNYTDAEINQAIQELSAFPRLLREYAQNALAQNDIFLSAYGNYSETEIRTLAQQVETLFPQRLSPANRQWQQRAWRKFDSASIFWTPLPENQPEDYYGITRMYSGPGPETDEALALKLIRPLLHNKVYEKNRVEYGLGYVEKVEGWNKRQGGYYLAFSGEAQGSENLALAEKGFAEVIAEVTNHTLSADDFETEKAAYIKLISLALNDPGDAVNNLAGYYYFTGKVFNLEEEIARVQNLTAEKIYQAAETVFKKAPLTVIASRPSSIPSAFCNNALRYPTTFRGAVRP